MGFTGANFLLAYFAGTLEVAMPLGQASSHFEGVAGGCNVYSYSLSWEVPRWNDLTQTGTIPPNVYSDCRVVIPFGVYFELATGYFEVKFNAKDIPEDPIPHDPVGDKAYVAEDEGTFDQVKALFR